MTYLSDITEKYNGVSAFYSINKNNLKRCYKRMQKKTAELGASKILLVNSSYNGLGFIRLEGRASK